MNSCNPSKEKDSSGLLMDLGVKGPVVFWVKWKPTAPNQLRYRHWSVASKSSRAARRAWDDALQWWRAGGGSSTLMP